MVTKEKTGDMKDKTAYAVFDAALEKYKPHAHQVLRALNDELVVVKGSMDHIEQVLDVMHLPYQLLLPERVGDYSFEPRKTVFIDCPGQGISRKGLQHLQEFVHVGGTLVTSDWAVKHVLEEIFPGKLLYTGKPTKDLVVKVDVDDKSAGHFIGLDGLVEAEPKWWLEGSSYPIKLLSKDVTSLLRSQELGRLYGSSDIAAHFPAGEGNVYHFVSHLYLQRNELRNARDRSSSVEYASTLGLDDKIDWKQADKDTALGDIESRFTIFNSITSVLTGKETSVADHKVKKPSATYDDGTNKRLVRLEPHYAAPVLVGGKQYASPICVALNGKGVTLGRSAENTVCIHDTAISRQHCRLELQDSEVILRDLNSSNGTYYNGNKIPFQGVSLKSGGKIQLGKGYFAVYLD